MKRVVRALACVVACAALGGGLAAREQAAPPPAAGSTPPPWAYPVNPPAMPGAAPAAQPPSDEPPRSLPGTAITLTLAQTRDAFNVPDWRPAEHPPMPEVVSHGRKPDLRACGYCHLPNGQGRPENSAVAGLPAAYIAQQMADYKAGLRKSAEPKMGPPNAMIAVAKAATDEDIRIAAEYFASVAFRPWVRVVEAATVPTSKVSASMWVATDGTEPIGSRIVEVPENLERTSLRDPGSGFVAYVPPGSIRKGEVLVTTGGAGKTAACGICHGADLKGLGPVPPLAGRSPSYVVRQMYDMQHGVRRGAWSDLMKAAVAKLTIDDMVSIAAYTASRKP